ncbi:hypothetical protein QTG54_004980 [Skeletonema marinoi]|uniref:Uncharacterized protein n=1 Tax=Skeletonema marinoi TaxID=267567 RepID=A0AAD9DEP0_9STRA|nr:hypothetical protein QTG54_004980 [Skeletonema marinoi]
MPPKKKTKLTRPQAAAAADEEADPAVVEQLDDNVIAIIFGCFPPEDTMRMRVVKYNAMRVVTTALPNLQQITICRLGNGHKYSDGEDPDEEMATAFAHFTTHDINIISNFRKLHRLNIDGAFMNGRYPALFNFPLLEKLRISLCCNFKWELEMLSGFPSLRELDVECNRSLRGNIGSLNVLKNSLEKVKIIDYNNVEGNFMDLLTFLN